MYRSSIWTGFGGAKNGSPSLAQLFFHATNEVLDPTQCKAETS
jgi:hypothetical protein